MKVVTWTLGQFLSYGAFVCSLFGLATFLFARYGGWRFVPVGHLIIAIAIVGLDVAWVQSEMAQPGWNGTPDMDIIFHFGVLARTILINTLLLPVAACGLLWRAALEKRTRAT
ncbi:MAG TPA: hypothetical protein VEJ63_21965 [Planctomycetota bacterium]|nr:hypothetical protein [Planctomycetota bacterium]